MKTLQMSTCPEKRMHYSSKSNAKKRGLSHTITPCDIVVPDKCPYLDVPLTNIHGNGVVFTNCSIDRIDNSKGYTPDNIQVISRLANIMKHTATEEELVTFANNVLRLHES